MNKDRLKKALRTARERAKHTWRAHDGEEIVSLPLPVANTLIKAATKELTRT